MKRIVDFGIFNESVRDKMTGKLDKLEQWCREYPDEVIKRFKDAFPHIVITDVRVYRVQLLLAITIRRIKFSEYDEIRKWFDKNTNYTIYSIKLADENCLFLDIDKKRTIPKTNESVRDMMTPKSDEDIINSFENYDELTKKKIITKLAREKFRYTQDFYDFAEFILGMSDWRRITKKLPANNRNFYEIISKLRKHEINKLFKALLNQKIFLNEGIRDFMTPKSEEEIKKSINELSEEDIFNRYILAIIDNNSGVLDALKKAGCSINSRNSDKQTPLMDLLCNNHIHSIETVRTIVKKYGADMNLKDRNDRTALMYAVDNNKFKIVTELLNLGVDIKKWDQGAKAMIRAIGKEKDYEMIWDLIDHGVDVNYTDNNHSTALIYASLISRMELVRLLIKRGADVNIQNENGNTALMNAVRKDNELIVKMLLDAGADVTLKNHGNQTAYDIAVNYHQDENAELIKNHKKVNESVRDMMTPKSKKEIDEELEEMEPFERLMTIFNQQIDDINMGITPYYTQEQIDRMIPDFIDTANDIFDIYEKIEALCEYYTLSVLIREELKRDLKTLPATEQIQYVHDVEYLGGLYTDSEWAELGKRASEER